MISEAYKRVLCDTRVTAPNWGNARRHAPVVARLLAAMQIPCGSILDFGCGLGRFGQELERLVPRRYRVVNYDPSVKGWDVLPGGRFDAVVCTHVLEHVEPELLDATLREIHDRAERLVYIELPHGPAGRTLADGRNAHLIQQPAEWWFDKLRAAFPAATISQWPGANPINTVYLVDL